MNASLAALLASLPESQRQKILAGLTASDLEELEYDWRFWGRPAQIAPDGDWRTFLTLAGRGWGKSEAGAQWVRERVKAGARSIALVAETQKDLEEVMVARILKVHPQHEAPTVRYKPVRLTWPNGAVALGYNGTEPNQLRGPEFDTAWVDELCLVAGTLVETEFGPAPIESLSSGQRVWTRRGLRDIKAAWMSHPAADVWRATTRDGREIIGTGNHPVWTEDRGFTPLQCLRNKDTVTAWKNNALSGEERLGICTETTSAIEPENFSTGSFTKTFTGRCPWSSMSITSTATRPTTTYRTWLLSAVRITCESMGREGFSFGMLSGVAGTLLRTYGQRESLWRKFALFVVRRSSPSGCEQSTAVITANRKHSGETIPDTTRDEIVSVERLPFRAAVYNIEVDGEPEYFANGILTHNCKYRYAAETWDMLQFTMRAGHDPRVMVTTTPRPIPIIRAIIADPTTVVSRGSTFDNAGNLPPAFIKRLTDRYAGTRLGRQELNAEILDDVPGALWTRAMIDAAREMRVEDVHRIVVAVDPSGTGGMSDDGDSVGIVVAGRTMDGRGVVLADRSCKMSPGGWARRAVDAYHEFGADRIVAERNYGGAMVEYTIRTVDPSVSYKEVVASRGKAVRAEPVAALYEQGKIAHPHGPDGGLIKLEDQMCQMASSGFLGDGSPDRVDALVWALTELLLPDDRPLDPQTWLKAFQ